MPDAPEVICMETVIVAFSSEKAGNKISEFLDSDIIRCVTADSCAEVCALVKERKAAVVVCGGRLKDGSCTQLRNMLPKHCFVLAVTQPEQQSNVADAVFHLSLPVTRTQVQTAVSMLIQAGKLFKRKSSAENDLIALAKSFLMERKGMTEEQAHRFIQKKSMDHGMKMLKTAGLILNEHKYIDEH